MSDYWMALQIVQEAFRENLGALDKKTEKYLEAIKESGRITPGNLAKIFIEFSGDEPDAVKVLTQIQGGEGNIFEKAQEGPGNGHGNQMDALLKGFEGTLF